MPGRAGATNPGLAPVAAECEQKNAPFASTSADVREQLHVAVSPDRDRPLTPGSPLPSQDRPQAEPVLVEGPDLDRPARVPLATFAHLRGQLFLYAACSSGLAASACRGLGTCALWPSFLR